MFTTFKKLITSFKQKSIFENLPESEKKIVFFSESNSDWPHIGPIIKELLKLGEKVTVLTSDPNDRCLSLSDKNYKAFWIGEGTARTILFQTLKAKSLIMTMPDLETFALKRSQNPVKYIYLFHSCVSTHMVYRPEAFDHYDIVFTVGKHHEAEIRKREKQYNLKPKELIPHGYVKLDTLLEQRITDEQTNSKTIVIAPSWGENSIVEMGIAPSLIDELTKNNYSVYLRAHPMTTKSHFDVLKEIESKYSEEQFKLITNMNEVDSITNSTLMISDWSGAALDFSYCNLKPVLFINTPRKVNNKNWSDLELTPFEDSVRFEIGKVLEASEIEKNLVNSVETIISEIDKYKEKIKLSRDQSIYNVGSARNTAAQKLIEILNK